MEIDTVKDVKQRVAVLEMDIKALKMRNSADTL